MRNDTDYIETYTGMKFYPFSKNAIEVNILDIGHSLSHQCRFGGHCKEFYSVAQHSLLVAEILKDRGANTLIQLFGLLHDATETYMIDLPSPMKKHMPEYKKAENVLHDVIWEYLELPIPTKEQWEIVKEVDVLLLQFEAKNLLSFAYWADHSVELPNVDIKEELPSEVKKRFISRYESLRKEWYQENKRE